MKEGDKVTLKPNLYTENVYNPLNTVGKILNMETEHTTSHRIKVLWSNEEINQYRSEDLIVVSETPVINNNYSIY